MTKFASRSAARVMLGAGLVFGSVATLAAVQPAFAQDRDQTRGQDQTKDQDKLHDTTADQDRTKAQDKLHDADQTKDQDKLHDQDMDKLHDQDMDRTHNQLQTHDSVGPGTPSGAATGGGDKGGAGPH